MCVHPPDSRGRSFFRAQLCEVRCWRWLFGSRILISLRAQRADETHGYTQEMLYCLALHTYQDTWAAKAFIAMA